MNTLAIFVCVIAAASASVQAPLDSSAVIAGPSGTVVRSGLTAAVAPVAYASHYGAPAYYYGASPVVHNTGIAPVVRSTFAAPVLRNSVVAHSLYNAPLQYNSVPLYHGVYGSSVLRTAYTPYLNKGYAAGYGVHGFEGQYIPDVTEKLYDDGSYKPYLYGY